MKNETLREIKELVDAHIKIPDETLNLFLAVEIATLLCEWEEATKGILKIIPNWSPRRYQVCTFKIPVGMVMVELGTSNLLYDFPSWSLINLEDKLWFRDELERTFKEVKKDLKKYLDSQKEFE